MEKATRGALFFGSAVLKNPHPALLRNALISVHKSKMSTVEIHGPTFPEQAKVLSHNASSCSYGNHLGWRVVILIKYIYRDERTALGRGNKC